MMLWPVQMITLPYLLAQAVQRNIKVPEQLMITGFGIILSSTLLRPYYSGPEPHKLEWRLSAYSKSANNRNVSYTASLNSKS